MRVVVRADKVFILDDGIVCYIGAVPSVAEICILVVTKIPEEANGLILHPW